MTDKAKTLYEILGVERTASAEEIARAYRAEAKTAHPDVGGTAEDFAALVEAYDILSDADARAHYDATGRVNRKPVDGGLAAAMALLSQMLVHICVTEDPTLDRLESVDLVKQLKKMCTADLSALTTNEQKTIRARDRATRMRDRFRMRTPEQEEKNPFHLILDNRIAGLTQDLENIDGHRQALKRTMALLDDASFRVDLLLGGVVRDHSVFGVTINIVT